MTEQNKMTVVVCVKEVVYVYAPAELDRKTGKIAEDSTVTIINPFDEYALEWALKLKSKMGNLCKVVVLAFGQQRTQEMLHYCLSLGADEACLIRADDFPHLDARTRAMVLSHGVRKIGFDLVFCGKQAIDDNLGLVGGYLAGFLNIPLVSPLNYVDIDETNQKIIGHRVATKTELEKIRVTPPIMFLFEKGGTTLSYPSLPGIFNSRQKKITELTLADLDLKLQEIIEHQSTQDTRTNPPKPKPMFTIDSSLSAADRLKMMRGGGLAKKTNTNLLEGKKEEIIPKIVQYIIDQVGPF